MKKILVTAVVILFSTLSVNAVTVNYGPTGHVKSVSGGYGYNGYGYGYGYGYGGNMYGTTRNVNNFGSNASFLPQNIQRNVIQQRHIENEKQYLESLKNSQNINVNVNHNGFPVNSYYTNPYNRYYNNGYYNNGYYNYGYGHQPRMYYNTGNGVSIPGLRVF